MISCENCERERELELVERTKSLLNREWPKSHRIGSQSSRS